MTGDEVQTLDAQVRTSFPDAVLLGLGRFGVAPVLTWETAGDRRIRCIWPGRSSQRWEIVAPGASLAEAMERAGIAPGGVTP